jgi:hypothetical protein
VLENTKRSGTVILTNSKGLPWQQKAFQRAWGAAAQGEDHRPAFPRPARHRGDAACRG